MLAGKAGGIVQGIAGDTGLHGGQEQLQKRRDDGALALLHGARANLVGIHPHIVEPGGATGRQALAHGVEIVQQLQALAVTGQYERHRLVVLIQGHGTDPVGIQGTCAVVLAAAGPVVLAVTHDARADRAVDAAHFPAGIAQHRTVQVACEPALALGLGALGTGRQQPLDKAEAGAQRLGDVGVHRGNAQQQADHVADAAPRPAVGLGDAAGVEPGLGNLAHGVIGQLAFALTLRGTGTDQRQQVFGVALEVPQMTTLGPGYCR
ncbi:hypothetical protein D3C77_455190 [compost metagenome]